MSYHLHILDELRKLVVEEADETAKIIIEGVALKEYHAYKEHVGRLFAYRRTLDMFEEAARNVEKSS